MGMQAEAEFPPRHAGKERASRAAKDTVIRRKKSVLKRCARSLTGLPTAQAASSSLGFWHATTMLRRTTGPSRSKATTVRPKYDTSSRSRVDQLLCCALAHLPMPRSRPATLKKQPKFALSTDDAGVQRQYSSRNPIRCLQQVEGDRFLNVNTLPPESIGVGASRQSRIQYRLSGGRM